MGMNKRMYTLQSNPEELRNFFRLYNYEHFLHKLHLLQRCYQVEKDEAVKKMIMVEIHFLFFQVAEVLFSFAFLLRRHDESEFLLALSFSGDGKGNKSHYHLNIGAAIENLDEDSDIFDDVSVNIDQKGKKDDVRVVNYLDYLF